MIRRAVLPARLNGGLGSDLGSRLGSKLGGGLGGMGSSVGSSMGSAAKFSMRLLLLLLFALLIIFAVLTAVLRLGSPYVSSYSDEMQTWVSNYLGTPVEIGSIDFEWHAASPTIMLENVALLSEDKNAAPVKLDRILLNLDLLKTIFVDGWHINEVTIAGADLSLEYVGAQNFRVRGYEFRGREKSAASEQQKSAELTQTNDQKAESSDDGLDVLSWLLNAGRVGLIDSRIKLLDATRGIDYVIDALNIRAENSDELHRLRVDLSLPDQLGERLEIEIDLDRMPEAAGYRRASDLSGEFYISGEQLNLKNWAALWPQRNIGLVGKSDLRLWASWKGDRIYDARGQIEGQDITLSRLTRMQPSEANSALPETEPRELPLATLLADVNWERKDDGWVTEIDRLEFSHAGVVNELRGTRLSVLDAGESRNWQLDAAGELLDLSVLGALTSTLQDILPLGEIPAVINAAKPDGQLSNWALLLQRGWQGRGTGRVPGFSVSGRLDDFSTRQFQGVPALSGLGADVRITDNVGELDIRGKKFSLRHPSVFPTALQLDEIAGRFAVKLTDREFSLETDNLSVVDDDFSANNSFTLQKLRSQSARIELRGDFALDDISRLGEYLPRGKIRKPVASWIERAFKTGRSSNGKLLWFGDPARFPYTQGDGVFKVSMDVADGTLDYLDEWPPLTDVSAEVRISGPSIKIETRSARFDGIALGRSSSQIRDLFKPVLEIEAQAKAPLQEFIRSANTGPLRSVLNPAFDQSTGSGNALMTLAAKIPLRAQQFREVGEVFNVVGDVSFAGNTLDSKLFGMAFKDLDGSVKYTHNGFSIEQLNASYLGQPIEIGAHTSGRGESRISELSMSGLIQADEVLRQYDIPLDEFFSGRSPWYMNVEIPHKSGAGTRFTASSELAGTAVSLPEPFAKAANARQRIIVSSVFGASTDNDVWTIQWPGVATARVKAPADTGLESMVLSLGKSAQREELPTSGFRISGSSKKFALDGWVSAIDSIVENLPPSDDGPELLLPVSANISVNQLIVGRRSEGPAKLRFNTDAVYLNAAIDSSVLKGNIRIPRAHWDKDQAVMARITHAEKKLIDDLAEGPEGTDGASAAPLDPREIPRLNVHLVNFKWDDLMLRDVTLRSEPSNAGMTITTLGFANDHAQLTGEGYWRWKDPQKVNASFEGQQITQLDLQLLSGDIGKAVANLGFSDAMAEGKGSVDFDLNWNGPLYKPTPSDLRGNVKVALKSGRILKVEPGAARMFGLFALQSIPRRLTLDFRDIFRDGLDYNRINGEIVLADGLATSQLIQLEGPVGVVDVTGASNYIDRTYNQKITVLPRISGALPIIGLISGGATAGIGALIAGPLLKALGIDIDKLGLSRYKVTGSWDDPQINPEG